MMSYDSQVEQQINALNALFTGSIFFSSHPRYSIMPIDTVSLNPLQQISSVRVTPAYFRVLDREALFTCTR